MMELLPAELRENLPKLYEQEGISDPVVHIKFFFPAADWTWFATEGQAEGDDFTFFGYVIGLEREWGYFSLRELEGINVHHLTVERDLDFRAAKMSICLARWKSERGGREFLIHPSKPNFVSEFHSSSASQEENKAVGKYLQKPIQVTRKTMNTNQKSAPMIGGTNPFASAVLQNFFSKKQATSDEEIGENVLQPEAAEISENAETVSKILTRLDNKKERAAVNLGIGANEVETMPFDLSQLETEGIFLNIDCSGFGALQRQLDWKTLGVELPAENSVSLAPPRAGLLPDVFRKKLLRGAAQAHNALNKFSFRFTLCETVWGTSEYKWIPWNAFESFESEYKQACETLSRAKSEVLMNYDEILITLRASFTRLAEDSAQRLEATQATPIDRPEFVANVVARAMGMIPSREMIRDGLIITMKTKVIVLGSEMLAEQKKTRELNLERTRVEAETRSINLELDTKTRIEQIKLVEFERDTRREQEVKERIRQMKIEAAREAAAEAVSPIREGLNQITAKIYEAAEEMAAKMQTADFVSGSLAKRARQMCEWYELMNFTQDKSLEEVLQRLQSAAERDAKLRSPAEMQAALNDVLRATTIQSKRLLDEDRLSALEL